MAYGRMPMTSLTFDDDGVDVIYEGIEFHLERALIEEAVDKPYPNVTDHEVLKLVEKDPDLSGEPRQIKDIIRLPAGGHSDRRSDAG